MLFKFKWNKSEAFHVNPSKYEYAQAANSMLKMINFDLQDIKDWVILYSEATHIFF